MILFLLRLKKIFYINYIICYILQVIINKYFPMKVFIEYFNFRLTIVLIKEDMKNAKISFTHEGIYLGWLNREWS